MDGKRLSVVYGRTAADMTARAAEVWTNYVGVWHMNGLDADGRYPNSALDARLAGVVSSFSRTGAPGKFGQSVLVYTNAAHLTSGVERGGVFIPDGGALDLGGGFAVSGWFNHAAVAGNDNYSFRWDNIFCKRQHPESKSGLNNGSKAGFAIRVAEHNDPARHIGVNGQSNTEEKPSIPWSGSLTNGVWRHLAVAFGGDGAGVWIDGASITNLDMAVSDNDEPLVVGNAGKAWQNGPDGEGDRAWGGYADEVRLHRGAPSAAYLAAEYRAMANALSYGSETCALVIDKNEHFGDAVAVSSDAPPAANGEYYAGTTITLAASPDETGAFRKWYGDVPRESRTNATVSFVISRDSWVYARFVHPWVLAADKTTMSDGNFTVNVSVHSEAAHTLVVGRAREAGLAAADDTGTGTIDLGGPISLAGDETPWTIARIGGQRGSQVFPISREGVFRYLSPGTLASTGTSQPFHCGDSGDVFGKSYSLIIFDEPTETTLINTYCFTAEASLDTVILDVPNLKSPRGERMFGPAPLGNTRLEWWDLSSAVTMTENFFAYTWGDYNSLRRRAPLAGKIALPAMRGLDWSPDLGTLLCMMPNLEEISLGGATQETTVTNLCTYAFAGDSLLRKLTIHAAADMTVGRRIFADRTHNTSNGVEVIDGVAYPLGTQTAKGRVPDEIHFTGEAISAAAIANLLDACPVVDSAAKPVAIYASRFQAGWAGDGLADWISAPTLAERVAYPGKRMLGVYRAGAEAPSGKAVVLHRDNAWDKGTPPGLFIRIR